MHHEDNGKNLVSNILNCANSLSVEIDLLIEAIDKIDKQYTLSDGSSVKLTIYDQLSRIQQKVIEDNT